MGAWGVAIARSADRVMGGTHGGATVGERRWRAIAVSCVLLASAGLAATVYFVGPAAKQKDVQATASVVRAAPVDGRSDTAQVLVYLNQATTSLAGVDLGQHVIETARGLKLLERLPALNPAGLLPRRYRRHRPDCPAEQPWTSSCSIRFMQLLHKPSDTPRRHRSTGCIIRPLRDRKANTRIDGFITSHRQSVAPEVSPPRPPELSPMS